MASSTARGIIWDVDGTLVDTAKLHFDAWLRLARELGRDFTEADFAATFGRRNPEIMDYLFDGAYTYDEGIALSERKEGYYRTEAEEQGIEFLPGVRKLVEAFAAMGIPQAIGSSAPVGNLTMILRLTDSAKFFHAVVGMEDTRKGKPEPEVFLTGATRMNVVPAACLVFEDAIAGIEAATAAGMASVGVTFVGHHPAEKLSAAGATRIVRTLEELTPEVVIEMIDTHRNAVMGS